MYLKGTEEGFTIISLFILFYFIFIILLYYFILLFIFLVTALERAEWQGLRGLWSVRYWLEQTGSSSDNPELSQAGAQRGWTVPGTQAWALLGRRRLSAGWFSTVLPCAEFFSSSQFRLSASDTDAQRTYTKRRSLNTGNSPV